jgi:two-component system nitrate/nitrite response regulator NarL
MKTNVREVLIVDDHTLFREGLSSIFELAPDYRVIDHAGSVKEGIEKALLHKPEIILMDFSLPDGTGLDATAAILDKLPDTKIVFLTVYETDENLLSAMRLGARGYVLKNISGPSLIASLDALFCGELAISRKMMSRAFEISMYPSRSRVREDSRKLSRREIDILYELQNGASNFEIAERLSLSQNTVKHHIQTILNKLGAENRRQAVVLAQKMDLKKSDYIFSQPEQVNL